MTKISNFTTIYLFVFKRCSILELLQPPAGKKHPIRCAIYILVCTTISLMKLTYGLCLACLNTNLDEILGSFSKSNLIHADFKNNFVSNWNTFGVNECPEPVEITTLDDVTTEQTTITTAAVGVLGPETGFLFITTSLMYLVTRFVVV